MLIMDSKLRPAVSQVMKSEWLSKFHKHKDLDEADHIFLKKALNNMQKFKVFLSLCRKPRLTTSKVLCLYSLSTSSKGPKIRLSYRDASNSSISTGTVYLA
jgi:hypothetical protein